MELVIGMTIRYINKNKSSRIAKFNYFSYDFKKYGYKDIQGNFFKFCLPFTKENLKKIKNNLIKG